MLSLVSKDLSLILLIFPKLLLHEAAFFSLNSLNVHCMVEFSFVNGLILLPSLNARFQDMILHLAIFLLLGKLLFHLVQLLDVKFALCFMSL